MKTHSRNIALAMMAFAALSFAACTEKEDEPQDQASACKLTGLGYHYSATYDGHTYEDNDSISFQYDSNKRLYRCNDEDGYWQFSYNASGQLLKEEYFEDGESEGYGSYTYSGNLVTIVYTYQDEYGWISDDKTVYTLNSSNQIEKIEEYDSIEGSWVKTGYAVNTWQNGNLVTQEAYESESWKSTKKRQPKTFDRKREIRPVTAVYLTNSTAKDNFYKYRTTTFTYDNKNNPFSYHAAFRFWSEGDAQFNSKNNLLTGTIAYIWGEENTDTNTYQYNEYNFPTQMNNSGQRENYSWTEQWNFAYECN